MISAAFIIMTVKENAGDLCRRAGDCKSVYQLHPFAALRKGCKTGRKKCPVVFSVAPRRILVTDYSDGLHTRMGYNHHENCRRGCDAFTRLRIRQ